MEEFTEPEEFDDEEEPGEEENPDPNGGPSVAGVLLVGFGVAMFLGLPLRNQWMDLWAVHLLNWPVAGAMVGGGIGTFAKRSRQGAIYGAIVGVCFALLSLLNGRLNPIGH